MGEKFPKEIQQKMRPRAGAMEGILVGPSGPRAKAARWGGVDDQPDHRSVIHVGAEGTPGACGTLPHPHCGHLSPAAKYQHEPEHEHQREHRCHAPPPSRPQATHALVHLDRMPADESEVEDLHRCLLECSLGQIPNGWREVSHWPADRMAEEDWTPAIWRSPRLAKAGAEFAHDPTLQPLGSIPGCVAHDGSRRVRENFDRSDQYNKESIPILESKGAEGQKTIRSTPDGHWVFKKGREQQARHYLERSSHHLVTAGQRNNRARLTATASESKYLGQTWFPVVGLSPDEAKAISVFTNSTPGRLQVMRDPGKTLELPSYSPGATTTSRYPTSRMTVSVRL